MLLPYKKQPKNTVYSSICATLFLAVIGGCTECLRPFDATVLRVHDGDTLTISFENEPKTIRLARIDAPELKQEFGLQSRDRLKQLCGSRSVRIEPRDTDRDHRIVAEVVLNGRNLNEQLVEEGLAWRYPEYDQANKRMETLENVSRSQRLGLWGHEPRIPPWEFRKEKRNENVFRAQLRKLLLFVGCAFSLVLAISLICFWQRLRKTKNVLTLESSE